MARTSRGLGRGLAGMIEPQPRTPPPDPVSGFPEVPLRPAAASPPRGAEEPPFEGGGSVRVNQQIDVGVDEIIPNARQPRHSFNPDRLQELAESIAQDGLVQPVVVRRHFEGYELIAGERRWRAAKAAGLRRIPAILREADDQEALLLAIVENVVRADLNPVEVARGYASLVDELGLGASDVARRVGRSRAAVANTMRLLDLPDDVLDAITKGDLTEGHGRAILQATDRDTQRVLAARVVRQGLTVRQTEALARRGPARKRTGRDLPASAFLDGEELDDLADALYATLGQPAIVRWAANGVRIEFELTSADDVARFTARLNAQPVAAAASGEDSLTPASNPTR